MIHSSHYPLLDQKSLSQSHARSRLKIPFSEMSLFHFLLGIGRFIEVRPLANSLISFFVPADREVAIPVPIKLQRKSWKTPTWTIKMLIHIDGLIGVVVSENRLFRPRRSSLLADVSRWSSCFIVPHSRQSRVLLVTQLSRRDDISSPGCLFYEPRVFNVVRARFNVVESPGTQKFMQTEI